MDSGTAGEMLKTVPVTCPMCKSWKLMVFFERKINNCFAIACMDCFHFQIYGVNKEEIMAWFDSHKP